MNKFKKPVKEKKERNRSAFSKALVSVLNGTFLGKDNLVMQLPFVFFVVIISISYISYGYYAEKTVKQMSVLEAEVKDLKSQNLSLQSKLELKKQQSSVAVSIAGLELTESVVPPFKVSIQEKTDQD